MKSIYLNEKVMLITGGAGGLGFAAAKIAASRGAKLVLADINLPAAQERVAELEGAGYAAHALHLDLELEESIKATVAETTEYFGGIDVLVNNAALLGPEIITQDVDIETVPTALWERTFDVNVRGTMLMTRESMPHLLKSKGNVINLVSNTALQGQWTHFAYSSSKASIIQMTRNIAASHGRKGIRANAVAPGLTLSETSKNDIPKEVQDYVLSETLRDQLGEPDDIGELIAWLASNAARNITGQIISSDGGLTSHAPGFGAYTAMSSGGEA